MILKLNLDANQICLQYFSPVNEADTKPSLMGCTLQAGPHFSTPMGRSSLKSDPQ